MARGNLAYDDFMLEEQKNRIKARKKAEKRRRAERKRKGTLFVFKTICACAVLFLSSVFMISRYIELDSTEKKIKSLESELKEIEAYTSQKTFELEQSVDLTKIEEIATTRLGMKRPEKYQIIYVNMKKEDTTEVTADEVEGVRNNILSEFNALKENISGIFDFTK